MSGYGNRTASDPEFDGHETRFDKHTEGGAYQGGHETYKSGTVGGAGFGNKSDPEQDMSKYDNSDLRFDSHTNTDPYSNATQHGSGTTGGAGYGNKTGSFSGGSDKKDSTVGKMMEKVGGMTKNEGLVEKGREKRLEKGHGLGEEQVVSK
ncbi:hypothetical protein EJ08DRAFT_175802 [Tothia fuscella]|uniref:Uncharacterized protein n=1 Tax=Tothia fuscella TaxID=1048955 RepID=A0A9P4TYV0_9PEZI|nr:hypothetical protein EJ08DRAFT_175802 [Tothia fuscella]